MKKPFIAIVVLILIATTTGYCIPLDALYKDNNGNRLTQNEPTLGALTYVWDALNRLQQLQDFNGRLIIFSDDSLSRGINLNISDIWK